MTAIPLGIPELDARLGGGVLPGNLVLLVEDVGAGARQFMYTSAVTNGLAGGEGDGFETRYGSLSGDASPPDEVHYASFTEGEEELRMAMKRVLSGDLVDEGFEGISVRDFSEQYFHLSHVPPGWYSGDPEGPGGDEMEDTATLTEELGGYLSSNAPGNLVLIDSLNDLYTITGEELRWTEFVLLLKGIKKASRSWGGVVLCHVTGDALDAERMAELEDTADAVLYFEWEESRHRRVRQMFLKKSMGVFPRIEGEEHVFEAGIRDEGYFISAVEKIL